MGSQPYNPADLDSPGYEYLRSYQAMSNLYYKLVALDYQREFCPLYKCPPINRFYFAQRSSNQVEQQFAFMCLCVWFIKDKCQMNFEADPRDYQDLDATVAVIFEALKLLLSAGGGELVNERRLFPLGRLKQGFGPEVIYCLNKFADRALEIVIQENPGIGQVEINYLNKQKGPSRDQTRSNSGNNSIMIGQPMVGGGLTTRPLGNYQVDDSSLVFDYTPDARVGDHDVGEESPSTSSEWQLDKLDRIASLFELNLGTTHAAQEDWVALLDFVKRARSEVRIFAAQSRPTLEAMAQRCERQMQTLASRESSLNANFRDQIKRFAEVWKDQCDKARKFTWMSEQINEKTDTFERYVDQLKELRSREVKLNDESKLVEMEKLTVSLERETQIMDLKLGLLLAGSCRTGPPER